MHLMHPVYKFGCAVTARDVLMSTNNMIAMDFDTHANDYIITLIARKHHNVNPKPRGDRDNSDGYRIVRD